MHAFRRKCGKDIAEAGGGASSLSFRRLKEDGECWRGADAKIRLHPPLAEVVWSRLCAGTVAWSRVGWVGQIWSLSRSRCPNVAARLVTLLSRASSHVQAPGGVVSAVFSRVACWVYRGSVRPLKRFSRYGQELHGWVHGMRDGLFGLKRSFAVKIFISITVSVLSSYALVVLSLPPLFQKSR